jgi:hypothetical protein
MPLNNSGSKSSRLKAAPLKVLLEKHSRLGLKIITQGTNSYLDLVWAKGMPGWRHGYIVFKHKSSYTPGRKIN